ncbi:hypothetical protein FQ087_20955 [Sporosarcina sp. ANT_H38]|uniref:hypothetical protein n=1 Tax=Sporosarcina sp. ANT_H38 TaxID=2597358 RepID=UPI0011F0F170|nr:hypothetical protein [Sporosarcina sp. ANT_H38]KAA0941626.1 hypothetical protein FQ087_20955 [Sporosarcina sp. ANT_H38]
MRKKVLKVDENGYLLFGEDGSIEPVGFNEEDKPIYEILDGYVDTPLPTDEKGWQLPFYLPRWTGEEWVEGKSQSEFDEEAFLDALIPSAEDIANAEFEIKILNILMEVELI